MEVYNEKQRKDLTHLKNNTRYFQIIKKLKEKAIKIGKTQNIKSKQGLHVVDKLQINERWANFYEELYHDDRNDFHPFDEGIKIIP